MADIEQRPGESEGAFRMRVYYAEAGAQPGRATSVEDTIAAPAPDMERKVLTGHPGPGFGE